MWQGRDCCFGLQRRQISDCVIMEISAFFTPLGSCWLFARMIYFPVVVGRKSKGFHQQVNAFRGGKTIRKTFDIYPNETPFLAPGDEMTNCLSDFTGSFPATFETHDCFDAVLFLKKTHFSAPKIATTLPNLRAPFHCLFCLSRKHTKCSCF